MPDESNERELVNEGHAHHTAFADALAATGDPCPERARDHSLGTATSE